MVNKGEGGGRGGYKTGGGASEVLPLQKEGDRESFSHPEAGGGAHNMFWGSFNTGA